MYIYNKFLVLAKKAVTFLKHINQYMKFKEKKKLIKNIKYKFTVEFKTEFKL